MYLPYTYICLEVKDVINWMGGILSQCMHMSNYHNVHFKYMTILFAKYTSINLGKNNLGDPESSPNLLN